MLKINAVFHKSPETPTKREIDVTGETWSNLAVTVRVSGFLPQPVDGVEVLVRAHIRKRLIQEIHQVSSSVHFLCGRGTADAWQRTVCH